MEDFWEKVKKELEDYRGRWDEFTTTVTDKVDAYKDLFPSFKNYDDFKDYFSDVDGTFDKIKEYITKRKWDTKDKE